MVVAPTTGALVVVEPEGMVEPPAAGAEVEGTDEVGPPAARCCVLAQPVAPIAAATTTMPVAALFLTPKPRDRRRRPEHMKTGTGVVGQELFPDRASRGAAR